MHLKIKPLFLFFGIVIGLLLILVFLAGGAYSCKVGGGMLSGLTCTEVDIVRACEQGGKIYRYPVNINNTFARINF